MAEKKVIEIDVNTSDAVKSMENLSKATHDVSASFEEVYGDLQPLTTRMGEAEDRLYELANAGKTTTQEYKDLLKTVGDYRKVQIKTDMAVDAAATTMGQKLGGSLQGVTAGFSIVQGAMGSLGGESKVLEESLLKVQSAIAISEGVKGFREAIPSIKAFGGALKAAIGSTGIGLLVVAVGTLVAYWDDIKSAVSGVSDEQEKLNSKTDANLAAQEAKLEAIDGQDNILKLQGKSEKQILQLKLKQVDAVIAATEASLIQQEATKKAQVAAAKRNRDILEGVITFLTAPLQLLLGTIDSIGEALGQDFGLRKGLNRSISSLVFDPKETADEADKTIAETKKKLGELKNQRAGFQLAIQQIDKDAKTKAVQTTKEQAKEVENVTNEKAQTEEEAEALRTQALLDEEQKRLDAKKASDDEYAEWKKEYDAEQLAYTEEWNQKRIDAELAVNETMKQVRMKDIENIQNGIDLIANLFEGNKKVQAAALIAQNAVSIAKTIIETKAANQAARAQGTALSIASGGASVAAAEALILRNNIGAGISIAGIIAATGKGLSALKAGGSPSGGGNLSEGGGGAGGTISPNFNIVGNSGINQLAQLQQTPTKAYVVSGDMTTAQALDRNRIENATLVQ